jgi:hypothetical protein
MRGTQETVSRRNVVMKMNLLTMSIFLVLLSSCAFLQQEDLYVDSNMDFSSIKKVAILPLQNLVTEEEAADRVRDTLQGMLLSTEAFYVLPPGEVARGLNRVGIRQPATPTTDELKSLSGVLGVDAFFTGVLREYGVVRSASSSANIISLSLQLYEVESGTIVWSASSTKGGITMVDRLFGGSASPMNDVTEQAINELIDKLFK